MSKFTDDIGMLRKFVKTPEKLILSRISNKATLYKKYEANAP